VKEKKYFKMDNEIQERLQHIKAYEEDLLQRQVLSLIEELKNQPKDWNFLIQDTLRSMQIRTIAFYKKKIECQKLACL